MGLGRRKGETGRQTDRDIGVVDVKHSRNIKFTKIEEENEKKRI